MRVLILTFTMLVGVGCMFTDANESIFKAYRFPSYPNLTHLCQQRVYPSSSGQMRYHITWDAFASESLPSAIVEYYLQKLGDAGFTKEEEGGIWRFPIGSPHPDRVLDIMPVEADGPHRSCDKKPPPNSHSIIIVSRTDPIP